MTHEEREALRELCDKATPGPWEVYSPNGEYVINPEANFNVCMTRRSCDSAFIAAARTALPKLLDVLDAKTLSIKRLRSEKRDLIDAIKSLRLVNKKLKARAEAAEAERDNLVALPIALRFGFGNLGVVPAKYEDINAGCVVVYKPQRTEPVGTYHEDIRGKDVKDINPVAILEFHNEESIDVWVWALEEARKLLTAEAALEGAGG